MILVIFREVRIEEFKKKKKRSDLRNSMSRRSRGVLRMKRSLPSEEDLHLFLFFSFP
jgi:hypothetical protein